MKKLLLSFLILAVPSALLAQGYYPEGTKWTEIRLDTLQFDSWYSKVGDEWVPNFETVEYSVRGEYVGKRGDRYRCVYTDGAEWTDSLTLLLQEEVDAENIGHGDVMLSVLAPDDDEGAGYSPLWPAVAYQFDWSAGKGIYFENIMMTNMTYLVRYQYYYGIIDEIKEDYFGGVRPLRYVDLDGEAPENGKYDNPQKMGTKGGRIIQGIGITEWDGGECLFGAPGPYEASTGDLYGRHYRSMLVHFERGGEILYDVWPRKEATSWIEATGKNGMTVRSTLFDLQGRPLPSQPSRGVYVREGRKYVRK